MKKVILLIVFLATFLLCACTQAPELEVILATPSKDAEATTTPSPSVETTPTPQAMPDIEIIDAPEITLATPTPAITPSGMSPDPPAGPAMYSSYAFMVSYDPARGWADFDFFDMLTGDDAIDWLVEREGYVLADAQAEVAGYADSEFILKNTNPQLRTIDLRHIPIGLMYQTDGTMVTGAEPIIGDLEELFNLYNLDADLVLDSFFYYITVDASGDVICVDQVYWP